jgi:hypothetical protein
VSRVAPPATARYAPRSNQDQTLSSVNAVVYFNYDVPLLEQPFRYVATVLIALAPPAQFDGTRIIFGCETQMFGREFELGRNRPVWRHGATPIRISSVARHN